MADYNFWETLKSVTNGASSTAKEVTSQTFGLLKGSADAKIRNSADKVLSAVNSRLKTGTNNNQPLEPKDNSKDTPASKQMTIGIAGILVVGVLAFFLLRSKNA